MNSNRLLELNREDFELYRFLRSNALSDVLDSDIEDLLHRILLTGGYINIVLKGDLPVELVITRLNELNQEDWKQFDYFLNQQHAFSGEVYQMLSKWEGRIMEAGELIDSYVLQTT